jgi:membrane protein implicated in regulation of membrane protease activity
MWTVWWVWVVAGLVLGILEMLTSGYIFLGFAIGAGTVGALLGLGILGESLPVLLLVYACAALVAWLGLRRLTRARKGKGVRMRGSVKIWDKDVNDN